MALVRRVNLLGQSPAGWAIASAAGRAAENPAGIPQQPIYPPHIPPAVPVAASPSAASPAPATEEAAAAPTMPASPGAILASFGLVVAGGAIAYGMPAVAPFRIGSTMAAYVAMLVFAAAVERLLEPFSHWLPGRHARNTYEGAMAAMMNGHPSVTLSTVAAAKAGLDRAVANRAVIVWGMATAVATIVVSASGFYLLRMIATPGWQPGIPPWVDALVTGLVVGSGTKPLHDLITRVQSTNESRGERA